jgi:FixJ family two-component response regulator
MSTLLAGPVVIIEDDASMRQALQRILRLGGLPSVLYASAEEYLASHEATNAACLIVDAQLPGITGFELHDRLFQARRNAPVIFITAFDDGEARAKADEAGAVAFLTKPFSGRALLDAVRRALGRRNAPVGEAPE